MSKQRNDIEDIYPLAPLQQGMLFHTLYEPQSGVYVEQVSCRFQGALNVAAFRRAWQHVADRHPVFRTAFVWEGVDEPIQVVRRQVLLPWTEESWLDRLPAEQEARLAAFLTDDRIRSFKPSRAPLMRLALFRLAEHAYHFTWTHHHLLIDGWSVPLVLQEVFTYYQACIQGREAHLAYPRPYRDYITWLQRQDLAQAEAFWRQHLHGVAAPTPLGVDHPDAPEASREDYADQLLQLAEPTTSALQALARQHGLTLNTFVQGAWALLLSRYSGARDVLFGSVVSGRPPDLAGVETMVGLFINTLPVRVRVTPDAMLLPWLHQLQDQFVELRQYEYTPLVQIQGWSEIPRGLPLFESFVVFENYPMTSAVQEQSSTPSLTIQNVRIVDRNNYPLSVAAGLGATLLLRLSYDRRRFDDDTIVRMTNHIEMLLEGMVAQPTRRLADLPLLTDAERTQLLVDWNATQTTYPHDQCVHQLFEAQVERTPEAMAVVFENEPLTYRELNMRANQLARHLQTLGVGPEVVVAVCIERSPELMLALLGVLKAGGAYLPLDSAYPQERLAFMLGDSQAPVILTQSQLLDDLPTAWQLVICLDSDWDIIVQQPAENPVSAVCPDNLAYTIYTSGSTGRPKGTMIPHQGLVNYLNWCIRHYAVAEGHGAPVHSPIGFDLTITSLFSPLLVGQRVMLIPEGHGIDGLLARLVTEDALSPVKITPSHLELLNQQLPADAISNSVQALIIGGEALRNESLTFWRMYAPHTRLINEYGPTETVVGCCIYEVHAQDPQSGAVPIGRPIANMQLYLLDGSLQAVPIGVSGEIYIGGVGLARGYHNRPDLTAERFIPHPFSVEPGARLYRTGDLARYRPDGNIEFLGRIDQQVKIRGFRVELGEIETVLSQHPAVQETVVVTRDDLRGDTRLVAYIVPSNAERKTLNDDGTDAAVAALIAHRSALDGELRSFLKERLPDYMVPSAFVVLPAWPLTLNGKLDRKELPAPDRGRPELEAAFIAPRRPIEELLASIWADVLGLTRVGIHDNFFALGGHSLLATQIISRAREIFKVELNVADLFEAPTVAEMAEQIVAAQRTAPELIPPPLRPVAREDALPLSFAQQRLWFLDQLQPDNPIYTIPVAVQLTGLLDVAALQQSLNEVVRRHEVLRTTFATVDGQPVQVIALPHEVLLPVIDLQALPVEARETEALRLAATEIQHPFDLAGGPLLRATLVRLDEQEHVVLLSMHHIVSDNWSERIFIRELVSLYTAYAACQPATLPTLTIQYADYAVWQREWLQGAVLEEQLAYWTQQLANLPTLELPTDNPRPPVPSFRGAHQAFGLPAALSAELVALSQREGVTLFMTLLTAFQVLLARYSGQDDIAVGTPIANRTRSETEQLIGFFVNTLVLRTDLSGNPSFQELLRRMREVCLGAYAHQDLPFEQVVETLQPTRDLSRHPLFQVMFTVENARQSTLELPGLTLRPLDLVRETVQFDLSLVLTETNSELEGMLAYCTDLFETATIARLVGHFRTLLAGIVADPTQRVSTLPLLTVAEQTQLLVDWNATQTPYPADQSVAQLFEAQVARTPDAVALVAADQHLTYHALNARANQLAHYLQQLEVGPEVRIAVALERSLELVVALLGILKAGGAYVPLDPAAPPERLAFMLQDSQAALVLTQPAVAERLPAHVAWLDLEGVAAIVAQQPSANPASRAASDALAYLIYTSGSAGRPKAVLVEQRNLVHLLRACQQRFPLRPGDVLPALAASTFDIALFELLSPLLVGATTRVLALAEVLELDALATLLQEVTVLHAVPSVLRALLQTIQAQGRAGAAYDHLRLVWTGGDRVPPALLAALPKVFRRAAVWVLYGPTEGTILATAYRVPEGAPLTRTLIGTPLPNMQVRLYDRHGQLVPVGVVGELYLGGAGVTRGYLHQAALTAERYVVLDGQRWYRSGDLARYLPDGTLEFVGRSDAQVKVRGYRIEPGEIESVLCAQVGVREAAVVARADAQGEQRLVAYLVSTNGQVPTVSELRSGLQTHLPEYMLPAAFVWLAALPLTRHGKLDRNALPAPDTSRPVLDTDFEAASTPAEVALARIWTEVLGLKQVGIHDNFFALGGDSILSIQVVARAKQAGLHFTAAQLFQHQTIAELAAVATTTRVMVAEQGLVEGPVPLTPIQHHFFAQNLPDPQHFNQTLLLTVRQRLDAGLLEQALQHLLRHHDALRLRFVRAASGWQQHNAGLDSELPYRRVDISTIARGEQRAVIEATAAQVQASLQLTTGPLLQVVLFDLGADQPQRLLLVIHHLVVDGISWRILLEDLQTAYAQLQRSGTVGLPPKTTAFQQWAEQLVAYAQTDTLQRELAYWLAPARQDAAPLPLDASEGANTLAVAESVSVALDAAETRALLTEVPPVYHTQINDVLLTALVQACAAWSGQPTLLVDLEGHGREEVFADVDLSRTVGWFTSLYPVLLDLRGGEGPGAALQTVKEQLRRAPNRGLGYGVLRYMSPDAAVRAQLAALPAAQVLFNYVGQVDQALAVEGLFGAATESSGPEQNPQGRRSHLLEVTGVIAGGQLQLTWTYSAQRHERATIERLAQEYLTALRAIIAHCQSPDAGGYTLDDFPLLQLNLDELDKAFGQVTFQ